MEASNRQVRENRLAREPCSRRLRVSARLIDKPMGISQRADENDIAPHGASIYLKCDVISNTHSSTSKEQARTYAFNRAGSCQRQNHLTRLPVLHDTRDIKAHDYWRGFVQPYRAGKERRRTDLSSYCNIDCFPETMLWGMLCRIVRARSTMGLKPFVCPERLCSTCSECIPERLRLTYAETLPNYHSARNFESQ